MITRQPGGTHTALGTSNTVTTAILFTAVVRLIPSVAVITVAWEIQSVVALFAANTSAADLCVAQFCRVVAENRYVVIVVFSLAVEISAVLAHAVESPVAALYGGVVATAAAQSQLQSILTSIFRSPLKLRL